MSDHIGFATDSDAASPVTVQSEIGQPDLVDRCLSGEIVVVPGFLQSTGIHDLVRKTVSSAVATVNRRPPAVSIRWDFTNFTICCRSRN